ncbi:hypothetical protein [Methanosarcina sp.]|uniref:hypothetical protein n=1 Tax=Methanosarcina sp. TaxID=2213 RepID=UPI003C76062B
MFNGRQQNGGNDSTYNQAENIHINNYGLSSDPLIDNDIGILNEIFDYIFGRLEETYTQTVNDRGDLTDLKKKIELNFSSEERITIIETFYRNWPRKDLVEEFIAREAEINQPKVDALIDMVQSDFMRLKHTGYPRTKVESNEVIQELAINYLPRGKRRNPEYVANAKAIILYLFEVCYFGKVTDEQQKNLEDYFGISNR